MQRTRHRIAAGCGSMATGILHNMWQFQQAEQKQHALRCVAVCHGFFTRASHLYAVSCR